MGSKCRVPSSHSEHLAELGLHKGMSESPALFLSPAHLGIDAGVPKFQPQGHLVSLLRAAQHAQDRRREEAHAGWLLGHGSPSWDRPALPGIAFEPWVPAS